MISGRSCWPREPVSNRKETPAEAATSRKTIGPEAFASGTGSSAHGDAPHSPITVTATAARLKASPIVRNLAPRICILLDPIFDYNQNVTSDPGTDCNRQRILSHVTNDLENSPRKVDTAMQKPPLVIDPRQGQCQDQVLLHIFGPLVMVLGVALTAIGMISYVASYGTYQLPRYFWGILVGVPLIGIGACFTRFGYHDEILRDLSEEVSHLATDTFHTRAEGTGHRVETIAHGEALGLTTAPRGDILAESGTIHCGRCVAPNTAGAKFCNQCGAVLGKPTCPGCGASLTTGARFCNQCGDPIGTRNGLD